MTQVAGASGKILLPTTNVKGLTRPFPVRVRLLDIPPEHHVWLTVERDGQHWPKEVALPASGGEGEGEVHEGGPAARPFSLSLWLVPVEDDASIREWFRQAGRLGWPPIVPPLDERPRAVRLDRVDGLTVG